MLNNNVDNYCKNLSRRCILSKLTKLLLSCLLLSIRFADKHNLFCYCQIVSGPPKCSVVIFSPPNGLRMEAWFHLPGFVNSQRFIYCEAENPIFFLKCVECKNI